MSLDFVAFTLLTRIKENKIAVDEAMSATYHIFDFSSINVALFESFSFLTVFIVTLSNSTYSNTNIPRAAPVSNTDRALRAFLTPPKSSNAIILHATNKLPQDSPERASAPKKLIEPSKPKLVNIYARAHSKEASKTN